MCFPAWPQVVTAALEQTAGAGGEEAVRPEDQLAVYDTTPSTARLHEDSTAATVRQQGALLALVLGVLAASHTDSPAEFLAGLLDVHHEDSSPQLSATVLEFLPHLLYIFYEGASPRDLALRHAWLKQLQVRAEASQRHVDLGECLNFAVTASRTLRDALTKAVVASGGLAAAPAPEGLPWDVRWLPGGARLLRPAARAAAAARAANRVALLARFLFLARVEEAASKVERPRPRPRPRSRPPPRAAKTRQPITVAEYSEAVSAGEMQDNVTSHPLIVHFKPFLENLDAFTETILSSKYVSVSTEEWATLEAAFQWRFRLAEQGALQLIGEPGSRQLDIVVARLTVHTHWLLKQMLSPLQELAKQDPQLQRSKCSKKLASILDSVSSVIKSCQTPLHQIGKKLRRLAGQPLPYSSSEQSELAQRIQRVADLLLIWPSSDPGHMKLQSARVAFLTTDAGKEARKYLVCAMENIRKSDQLELVTECVERVERLCDEASLTFRDSSGTEQKPKIQEDKNLISTEVQLWPVQEYIALCLGISFMKEHLNVKFRSQDESLSPNTTAGTIRIEGNPNISTTLCAFLEDLPSIPAEMLNIVRQLFNPSDSTNVPVCELIRISLLHHTLSPSRSLSSHWLSWNSAIDTSDNETVEEFMTDLQASQGSLPMHCPLLTNLVTNLVVERETERNSGESNLIAHSPLGRQHLITLKFNTLLNLLWRNMATLSLPNFCYKLNDSHCVYSVYLKLKETLNCILLDMSKKNGITFSSGMNIAEKFDNFVKLEGKSLPEVQKLSEALHTLEVVGEKLQKLLKKKESESDVEMLIAAGEAWMLVGCVQIILLTKFGHFDPVEKRTLQYLYVMEELKDTSQLLYARELQAKLAGLSLSNQMPDDLHPFIVASHQRLKLLSDYKNELHKNLAFRPSVQPYFCQLTKDASHYSSSLGSAEMILGLKKKLQNMCQQLQESIQHPALAQTRVHELSVATGTLLNEERMWRNSQQMFCSRLEKTYKLHFPDLVIPLLSAAQQLCHGTSLLASTIQKLLVRLKFKLVEDIVKLVQFPVAVPKQGVPLGTVSLCLDRVFCQQLQQLLCEDENDQPLKRETYRLMKSGLQDIRNIITAEGNVDSTTWSLLVEILTRVVKLWVSESDERKRKETEKQQIFIQKGTTQCETLSDEQLEALGLQEFFPTTIDDDFGDLTLNTDSAPVLKPVVSSEYLVSSEDMTFVSRLHFELMKMFTHTEWIAPPPNCVVKPNFVSPLLQRFQTFHQLLPHAASGLDSSVDWSLAPSLALLTSLALSASNGNYLPNVSERPVLHEFSKSASVIPERPPDFYHDSNMEEARQCLPVVSAIEKRTRELKKEWPDHPTLNQILVVIDRVTSFPITSPLSRFLTGLEFLLEKLQDWEENAHSKVSMANHMQHLTNQIISWRKLELQCWKDCLNTAAYRMATSASHWWFHIFSIVESFDKSGITDTLNTEKNLIKSLQNFMEKSVLGDFHARLDILFSFHCHAIHLSNSSRQSNLVNILWNVHQYYNQFSEQIALKIHDLRAPIEKKLRDFVKIARWNDINYWAVKKAVEKTRRTLLKYVREFEAILKQPVTSVITNPHPGGASLLSEAVGQLDRRQRRQSMKNRELPPDFYLTSSVLGASDVDEDQLIIPCETTQRATPLLNRAVTLFYKSRTLIKEALPEILYPQMIKTTDEIIGEMINTVNHLKSLEIPSDTSNQRRKSLAKSHLQLKKKALSDGFRTLQQIGISFRKGVAVWNDEEIANSLFDFNVPPLDLVVGVQHSTFQLCGLVKATSKGCRPDGELATVCDGSETYFYRSMARLSLLDTFLKNPHPDIGPALIERLRGFSSHLMIYAKMQKEKLIESFNLLRFLRFYMSQVASLKKSDTFLPRQSELHQCWRNLNNLLVNIILWAEQFLILLKACPQETESSFVIDLSGQSSVDKISSMVHADPCWEALTKKLKIIIASASKFKLSLNKSGIVIPENALDRDRKKKEMELSQGPKNLVTPSHYELIIEGYGKVSDINEELKTIKSMFENSEDCGNIFNPMIESLKTLETLIQKEVNVFKEMQTPDSSLKGSKRSDIEIENKELEICVNIPNNTKKVSEHMAMEVEENRDSNQLGNVQISLSNKHLNEHDKKKAVNEFWVEAEHLLEFTLIAIQKVYKKYTDEKGEEKSKEEKIQNQGDADNTKDVDVNKAEDFISAIQDNHLKEKILENLFSDLCDLQIPQVNKMLSKLIHRLVGIMDLQDWEKEATECKRALVSCIPCIDQLSLLHQFFVTQQAASYRVTCKMMSVILSISIDLAQKGFCIPPELMPQEGEEAGDPKGGLGLGEGEGEKDVSDKIQSEDQLEDARKPGEEKEDEQKDCKEEEKGIDSSQDFGGKIQDLEKDEEKDGSDDSEEEEEADKEMGEIGEEADKLDQEVWGSDSENEDEAEGEEKEDQHGQGETTGNPELSAKDDKREGNDSDEDNSDEGGDKKEKQKEINEFDEPEVAEDQVDPYHGKQPELPEPEPLDLPDDLQLDEEDGKEEGEDGENPFDIDAMKDRQIPEDQETQDEEPVGPDEETKEDPKEDSSDDDEEETGNDGQEKNDIQDSENNDEDESGEGNEGKEDNEKEEKSEEEEKKKEEKALPSDDMPSESPAQAADMEAESCQESKDMVAENKNEQKDDGKQDSEELGEEGGDEQQGVGQAQAEEQKSGHRGHMSAPKDKLPSNATPPEVEERKDKRQRPGESDSTRTLGDVSEPNKKRLKTIDIKPENEDDDATKEGEEEKNEEQGAEEGRKGEMYQHIKDSKESYDTQTLDAATQDQAEKQPVPNKEEESAEEPSPEDDLGLQDDDVMVDEDIKKQHPEQLPSGKKDKNKNNKTQSDEQEDNVEMAVDVEGDVVPTEGPSRGAETTFHTQYNFEADGPPQLREIDLQEIRQTLENQLLSWTQPPADAEAAQAWQGFVSLTAGLSRELSEQLRLVLEPTQAARLRGDYRTGRRINMRKVIPYIASQFRKDKIWLRRTKPSKREYQIVLAIDDSSSMDDNHTKELAFESLALVSQALSLLEAGELAVVSFGDKPQILHQLGDTFTEHSGGRLLQQFSFSQNHTKFAQLIDFCTMLLQENRQRVSSGSECAQLLMIVSDGRGVFSEGDAKVRLAIRHARQNRIFMVFVVLDNPDSKHSILDIKATVFQGGKLLGLKSYLDTFPFPFYLILRDINCLPAVLSDALRQWFELVTNTDIQ
ncbi:Midasin [Gryllus bimaculatus]|nr:Midasin [Gryllus bimaculatus]